MHNGSVILLTGVRFIPSIKRNLISLGMLELKGYSFMSSSGCMRVLSVNNTVMVASRKNRLIISMLMLLLVVLA